MEGLSANLSGLTATFSPASHQAFKDVYFTRVQDGKAVPVTKF